MNCKNKTKITTELIQSAGGGTTDSSLKKVNPRVFMTADNFVVLQPKPDVFTFVSSHGQIELDNIVFDDDGKVELHKYINRDWTVRLDMPTISLESNPANHSIWEMVKKSDTTYEIIPYFWDGKTIPPTDVLDIYRDILGKATGLNYDDEALSSIIEFAKSNQ